MEIMAGSSEQRILLEKRNQVGYLTFNRPEKLNPLRVEDYILYNDLVNDCEKDDNIRAVILTGKGRAFTVGDDLDAYPGSEEEEGFEGDAGLAAMTEGKFLEVEVSGYRFPLHKASLTIMNSGKVWIAVVHGDCWLSEFVFPMDFVIAADVATFAQAEVRAGITPAQQLIGPGGQELDKARTLIERILQPVLMIF